PVWGCDINGHNEEGHPPKSFTNAEIMDQISKVYKQMDLFNLISAPNPAIVKTGTRQRAAHKVPLLTVTASWVIDMEDVVVTSTSSNTTTTEVAPKVNLEREVTAMGPLVNKRRRKRDQSEMEANAPPKVLRTDHASVRPESHTRGGKSLAAMGLGASSTIPTPIPQETPADVIGPDPLSYARPQSIPKRDIAQYVGFTFPPSLYAAESTFVLRLIFVLGLGLLRISIPIGFFDAPRAVFHSGMLSTKGITSTAAKHVSVVASFMTSRPRSLRMESRRRVFRPRVQRILSFPLGFLGVFSKIQPGLDFFSLFTSCLLHDDWQDVFVVLFPEVLDVHPRTLHKEINTVNLIVGADPTIRLRRETKLEGSIAEGYVAEEALTFCSRYLKGVETRFNRRDRNEDGLNPTDKFQRVVWFVLDNSPEIEADIVAYKNKFPNNNAKEEFPPWFDHQLEEILELTYIGNRKVVLFRCKWFDTSNSSARSKRCVINQGIMHILTDRDSYRDQQYILATQARQVFYLEDPARRLAHWKVVEYVHHRKIWHRTVVESDQDVIHDRSLSDVALSACLPALEYTVLSNDESTEVDASPDNEVRDEEGDDFIDDEVDVVSHSLIDDDDEDDDASDDEVDPAIMACVAPRAHGGMRVVTHLYLPRGYLAYVKGQRGETNLKALKNALRRNKGLPLSVGFDYKDQKSLRPIGDNASYLSSLIGEIVKTLPLDCDSWEDVPPTAKVSIMPTIHGYFDLEPHFNDKTLVTVRKNTSTVGSFVKLGLQQSIKKQYRQYKNRCKTEWFSSNDSVEEAKRQPPSAKD
ncbi:acidic leucine-rich nuclear phosphoprotein 32 family member A, partial [Tanacetum coccineum]